MLKPVRVLLVTKSTGGVAEYVRQLISGLDLEGFSLTVACLSENGPEFAAELARHAGVRAFSLKMNRYKVDPFSDMRVLLALAAHLRKEKYDLVHAHASKPGFLTRLAAVGTGTPVLFSPHCFAFHAGTGAISARVIAALEGLAARYLTTRIVLVADGERELARRYGVGFDELFVTVHTGIDIQKYGISFDRTALKLSLAIPENARLVCSVGRLSAQKAPLDFVRMAAIINSQQPGVHFAWIGGGPLEESARALSAELGLREVLHFAGYRTDIPEILQAADCFVLPSLWEGFPIVLLEAMAAGAPVVATDIPGNTDAIRSGVDGWLVSVKNPQALAKAVLDVLNNPDLAKAFRENSKRRVEQEFTRQTMLERLAELYMLIASKRSLKIPQSISPKGIV
ncbi:MAG: glycosyltransferase family 4 protein [Chloroflexi bacterium]|nr:glycosyltransferase family 4 protein [Chloroflexota bacterium]